MVALAARHNYRGAAIAALLPLFVTTPAHAQNCRGSTAFLNCVITAHQNGGFTIPPDLSLPQDLAGRKLPQIGSLFEGFEGPVLPALRRSRSDQNRDGRGGDDPGHHHGGGNSGQGSVTKVAAAEAAIRGITTVAETAVKAAATKVAVAEAAIKDITTAAEIVVRAAAIRVADRYRHCRRAGWDDPAAAPSHPLRHCHHVASLHRSPAVSRHRSQRCHRAESHRPYRAVSHLRLQLYLQVEDTIRTRRRYASSGRAPTGRLDTGCSGQRCASGCDSAAARRRDSAVPGGVAPPIATLPPSGVAPTVPGGVAPPIATLPPSGGHPPYLAALRLL